MSTATLAPSDLVVEDMEAHFDDEVPCYRCTDAAVVLIVATCCREQRTMCPACAGVWRATVDALMGRKCACKGCGAWIPKLTGDWYRVVPL